LSYLNDYELELFKKKIQKLAKANAFTNRKTLII